MKRFLVFTLLSLLFSFTSYSQRVEITPFGGYLFAARMNGSGGYVRFEGNGQYGGMITIVASRVMDIDLIYTRSDTKAEVNYSLWPYEEIPLSINYIHGGFTKNFRINPTISPFVGFNLGACLIAPKQEYDDVWFFSVGMNAGVKIYFSKRVGLKLQGQLFMPIQGSGFTMFVGTGGAGGGVSLYGTMVQAGVSGGLIFRLGPVSN